MEARSRKGDNDRKNGWGPACMLLLDRSVKSHIMSQAVSALTSPGLSRVTRDSKNADGTAGSKVTRTRITLKAGSTPGLAVYPRSQDSGERGKRGRMRERLGGRETRRGEGGSERERCLTADGLPRRRTTRGRGRERERETRSERERARERASERLGWRLTWSKPH
eukprot:1451929-Rhodomonas_salina.4